MVGNTASVVGSYGVSRQDAGTAVEVRADGGRPEYECTLGNWDCNRAGWTWTRVSSTENTENVRVYRDGDAASSFESASGQHSAAAYVDPYVEGGEMTLDDNRAVSLFDFNHDDHDYQDAVVLVSFFTRRGNGGTRAEDPLVRGRERTDYTDISLIAFILLRILHFFSACGSQGRYGR